MPNGQDTSTAPQQPNVQLTPEAGQATPPAPPTDLAEAFAQLRAADSAAAQDSVEDSGNNEEPIGKHAKPEPAGEQGNQDQSAKQEPVPATAATEEPVATSAASEPSEPAADVSMGGNTVSSEPVDYTPARQQILANVSQQAVSNVAKRFRDNNIRVWEIGDLYDKDEQSGRVVFRNPDDENRPFQSRKEAQDFVDAMNKQINAKFQSEVREEQRRLYDQARPSLSMLDFVPVYQSMNDTERGVFDELITPYAIRDQRNNIIGFQIDLTAAANQARAIASRFASASQQLQTQQPKQAEASTPAVDMVSGTGEVASDEPKDLSEAFEMLKKKNKEEK